MACPSDSRIALKEEEINKHQDLAFEIKTLWRMHKVCITPVVIGALGSYTEILEKFLDGISVGLRTGIMHKTALLGSARILSKVLER